MNPKLKVVDTRSNSFLWIEDFNRDTGELFADIQREFTFTNCSDDFVVADHSGWGWHNPLADSGNRNSNMFITLIGQARDLIQYGNGYSIYLKMNWGKRREFSEIYLGHYLTKEAFIEEKLMSIGFHFVLEHLHLSSVCKTSWQNKDGHIMAFPDDPATPGEGGYHIFQTYRED